MRRSIVIALLVWFGFILLASAVGGFASFYTGKADELPKWNGWSYLFFSMKEFAMMGAILTSPFALVALVVSLFALRSSETS